MKKQEFRSSVGNDHVVRERIEFEGELYHVQLDLRFLTKMCFRAKCSKKRHCQEAGGALWITYSGPIEEKKTR